jgi:hypothetical protein
MESIQEGRLNAIASFYGVTAKKLQHQYKPFHVILKPGIKKRMPKNGLCFQKK